MRAVVQRVSSASVTIDGIETASISTGLLVLLGITHADTNAQAEWMANRISELRVFADATGRLNLSVNDIKGSILAVSQFTLYADASRGTRPSFVQAAPADIAQPIYDHFVKVLLHKTPNVATGTFGAMMNVALVNDGPVTIVLDREVLS